MRPPAQDSSPAELRSQGKGKQSRKLAQGTDLEQKGLSTHFSLHPQYHQHPNYGLPLPLPQGGTHLKTQLLRGLREVPLASLLIPVGPEVRTARLPFCSTLQCRQATCNVA